MRTLKTRPFDTPCWAPHPGFPTLSGWEALGGCWKVSRCRPGRKLWVTQASREVTKTGAGPHQPTVPEICSPRQRACSVGTGGSGEGSRCAVLGRPPHHPPHAATGHSPGRGRQLSLCTHQPRAPGPRGGAALLLNARQAWQSPRRRPRPRQLAAGHCREGIRGSHHPRELKGPRIQESWGRKRSGN